MTSPGSNGPSSLRCWLIHCGVLPTLISLKTRHDLCTRLNRNCHSDFIDDEFTLRWSELLGSRRHNLLISKSPWVYVSMYWLAITKMPCNISSDSVA